MPLSLSAPFASLRQWHGKSIPDWVDSPLKDIYTHPPTCMHLLILRFFLIKRGRRPELLQNMLDLRKRLRGPPKGPRVTIVVTDIEAFASEFQLLRGYPY